MEADKTSPIIVPASSKVCEINHRKLTKQIDEARALAQKALRRSEDTYESELSVQRQAVAIMRAQMELKDADARLSDQVSVIKACVAVSAACCLGVLVIELLRCFVG